MKLKMNLLYSLGAGFILKIRHTAEWSMILNISADGARK